MEGKTTVKNKRDATISFCNKRVIKNKPDQVSF